ncbi:unnamed protein product [Meganyctiphanes norvegica]|uniref:Uncharacterized protein n=1 Tax=Meganyctiphanes norvegica TaxID=48144 RepID=A0AAV2QXI2_MEGNR
MAKQTLLLRLIAMVGLVAALAVISVQVTNAITCYKCSDKPDSSEDYDPNCAKYDYAGHNRTLSGDTCYIVIYDFGGNVTYVSRGNYGSERDEGDCENFPEQMYCYCKTDSCNTGSYCEQCE